MSNEEWLQIPEDLRTTVGVLFRSRGYDLERVLRVNDKPEAQVQSDWMTRAQAAEYAHKSLDTIDNWSAKGFIAKSKPINGRPGSVLISRSSLEKFIRGGIVKHNVRGRNSGDGR